MLRVIASRNAKEYYAESLKREDYYTEGQEIRGEWQGIGAERLGLSGAADQAAFDALCENKRPGTCAGEPNWSFGNHFRLPVRCWASFARDPTIAAWHTRVYGVLYQF